MTKKYSDITFYYDLYTAMYCAVLFAEVLITDIGKKNSWVPHRFGSTVNNDLQQNNKAKENSILKRNIYYLGGTATPTWTLKQRPKTIAQLTY